MKKIIEIWKSLSLKQKIISVILVFSVLLCLFHPKVVGAVSSFYKSHLFCFGIVFVLLPLYFFFFPLKLPSFQKKQECQKLFELKKIKKASKGLIISVSIIFVLLLGVRVAWMYQKTSFHVDEWMSVVLSNRNTHNVYSKNGGITFDLEKEYSGEEIRQSILFDSGSFKDALKDVYHLHLDTTDSPHPNLYYILLRSWFSGINNSNPLFVIRWGVALNLIFFIISFIAMFYLLFEISDCEKTIPVALIISFANPIAVSNTLFMRPYALQEAFLILFSLCYVVCVKNIKEGYEFSSFENFISLSLITSLFMLTQYFSLFYIAILGFILLVLLVCYKKNNYAPFFMSMLILAFVLCKVFYQKYGSGLFDFRGKEAASKLSKDYLIKNIGKIIVSYKSIVHKNSMLLKFSVLLGLLYLFCVMILGKSKNKFIILSLFFVAFGFSGLVFYSAPYKVSRYIAAAIPVFSCIFVCNFDFPTFKSRNLSASIIISSLIASLFIISILPLQSNKKFIEHLDDSNMGIANYITESEKKLVIYNTTQWKFGTILPYLKDNHKVYFVKNLESLKKLDLSQEFYILIEPKKYSLPPEYEIIRSTNLGYFKELLVKDSRNTDKS